MAKEDVHATLGNGKKKALFNVGKFSSLNYI